MEEKILGKKRNKPQSNLLTCYECKMIKKNIEFRKKSRKVYKNFKFPLLNPLPFGLTLWDWVGVS